MPLVLLWSVRVADISLVHLLLQKLSLMLAAAAFIAISLFSFSSEYASKPELMIVVVGEAARVDQFSLSGRADFDIETAGHTENVLDVLQRTGVEVLWRDNNSDSKGVALRVPYESFKTDAVSPDCEGECRDVGMLSGMQTWIDHRHGDGLIVLLQMGNHGPAYSRRYPPEFERFKPV